MRTYSTPTDVRERIEIQSHVSKLIAEDDLPASTLERAAHFIRNGDLSRLMELPLGPDDMIEAGTVLLRAPSPSRATASCHPAPVLSEALRHRLRALVSEGNEFAEAALFILSQDLKARALNRALAKTERV